MATDQPCSLRLVARQANLDARCSWCEQMILGFDGRGPVDMMRSEPAHPLDTLAQIVKVDDEWVHADCARDRGHEVW